MTSDVLSNTKYLPTQCLDWNASSIEFYERAGALDNDDYCRKDEQLNILTEVKHMRKTFYYTFTILTRRGEPEQGRRLALFQDEQGSYGGFSEEII